ncbi:MAG: tRNA (N6-isopentenyl adenosine(37)-C2)-methylthiotransferase MiaB [Anaerolineae bacterium]|nr:tRNA (N6-isopentenyl adenosine(37)-C2)-methylthiotransferase MiaB [Anaerolineae bacterium]
MSASYHLWTIGCQMNTADSQRLAAALEELGYVPAERPGLADVIVLNTCVVRHSAEEKVYGRLSSLRPLKERRPELIIGVMGCLVGPRQIDRLRERFPWVDVWMPPSRPDSLLQLLREKAGSAGEALAARPLLPLSTQGQVITAYLPVVLGCSTGCSYCIIPYRRGPERSRPVEDIVAEAERLVAQGVREITLLGQIVDRYGLDLPEKTTLAALLRRLHSLTGLWRLRFLTSHPRWMSDELLDAVAELPKVCEHIELPVQAGDDEVLARMRRGYTVADYRRLVDRIRTRIPGVSIATDVIVGFPGETEAQFRRTYELLAELRLDKVHIARYSPRPQTLAARRYPDDVPAEEKERRRRVLEELQARITGELNSRLLGQTVEVLVEGRDERRGRWWGRTRTDRLVFFESPGDWLGRLAQIRITWSGPWSLVGEAATSTPPGYPCPRANQPL